MRRVMRTPMPAKSPSRAPDWEIHFRPPQGQSPKLHDIAVREQWAWISGFLGRCTNARPSAIDATLQIFVRASAESRPFFESAIAEASRRFGKPKIEPDVLFRDDVSLDWELSPKLIEAAVDFLVQGEPWALHNARPASLVYSVSFKLRDPGSGGILPHQTSRGATYSRRVISRIIGGVGPKPWIYPHFVFPFPRANRKFLSYLAAFTAELPFRLAPRHFRSVRRATTTTREQVGYLSPEDDERIRRAQLNPPKGSPHKRGAA